MAVRMVEMMEALTVGMMVSKLDMKLVETLAWMRVAYWAVKWGLSTADSSVESKVENLELKMAEQLE